MRTVILHHGLMGYNVLRLGPVKMDYWDGISHTIARAGYPVLMTRVHPTAGIARRAQELKTEILKSLTGSPGAEQKVVIIAHSMGGLDARYMITHLGMADRVEALITISTPHRGCAYYDHLIERAGMFGRFHFVRNSVMDIRAFWDVTMAHAAGFNADVPNAPGVRYYCVTASCDEERVPMFLRKAHAIVLERQGENDGLVAVESARWGTELAHWPFHHLHLVNWPLQVFSPPSFEDVRPRYLQLLSLLRTDSVLDEPVPKVRARVEALSRPKN